MDNLTQLFIRACKSKDPDTRVRSVYRRFYMNGDHVDFYITGILVNIVEKYMNVPLSTFMADLHPQKYLAIGGTTPHTNYNSRCFHQMISYIRLSNIDTFPGLTKAAKYRV